jgi:hypothetical protein
MRLLPFVVKPLGWEKVWVSIHERHLNINMFLLAAFGLCRLQGKSQKNR